MNILLTNADWPWPQAVNQIIKPMGINTLLTDNARDLVQLVSQNRIHLAIIDMALADLSGMHAVKMIRNQNNTMPCILLAQDVDKHLLARALALNINAVLVKPVNLALLKKQIIRLLDKYNPRLPQPYQTSSIPGNQNKKWTRVIKFNIRKKHGKE